MKRLLELTSKNTFSTNWITSPNNGIYVKIYEAIFPLLIKKTCINLDFIYQKRYIYTNWCVTGETRQESENTEALFKFLHLELIRMESAYMYLIKKVINNNVILVDNEARHEFVIIGKGLGFNSKAGEIYQYNESDELFIKPQDHDLHNFLDNIPIDIIKLTIEVIKKCKAILNSELSDSLVVTLSEHIMFAIERSKSKEMSISLYEVPYLYHLEFIAGKAAVDYLNEKLNIVLPKNEASLIAIHFVNAKLNNKNVGDTLRFTQIVYKIVNIINYSFHIQINTESENFSRFINHLRYLLIRCQANYDKSGKFNSALEELIEQELLKNFACARKISALIHSECDIEVSREEMIYLSLHIERLLNSD